MTFRILRMSDISISGFHYFGVSTFGWIDVKPCRDVARDFLSREKVPLVNNSEFQKHVRKFHIYLILPHISKNQVMINFACQFLSFLFFRVIVVIKNHSFCITLDLIRFITNFRVPTWNLFITLHFSRCILLISAVLNATKDVYRLLRYKKWKLQYE